jgi:hypothetical protein
MSDVPINSACKTCNVPLHSICARMSSGDSTECLKCSDAFLASIDHAMLTPPAKVSDSKQVGSSSASSTDDMEDGEVVDDEQPTVKTANLEEGGEVVELSDSEVQEVGENDSESDNDDDNDVVVDDNKVADNNDDVDDVVDDEGDKMHEESSDGEDVTGKLT